MTASAWPASPPASWAADRRASSVVTKAESRDRKARPVCLRARLRRLAAAGLDGRVALGHLDRDHLGDLRVGAGQALGLLVLVVEGQPAHPEGLALLVVHGLLEGREEVGLL